MTYGEIKQSILQLGYETSIDDEGLFIDGINRALRFINVEFPLTATFEVTTNGSDDFETIDFSTMDDFDVFLKATIKRSVGGRMQILPFADIVVDDNIVKYYEGVSGTVTFTYRTRPTMLTNTSSDDEELTIMYKAEPLLPLLSAFYIWGDDAPDKAAQWKNDYEDMKILVKGEPQNRFQIVGGI
jgi:hypothetical protein